MVLAASTQLQQVLMHLGANAESAMRQTGGVFNVRLGAAGLDAALAAVHPHLAPGPYVRLTVRDTGHGMPHEVMEVGAVLAPRHL
jgi:signal transduction histidine kinase